MWQAIQKWFQSKGGVAHVLAATYAFLALAYEMSPKFRDAVQVFNRSLPGWGETIVGGLLALAVFYKNWNKSQTPPTPPTPPQGAQEQP